MPLSKEELEQIKNMMGEVVQTHVAPIKAQLETHGTVLQGVQAKAKAEAEAAKAAEGTKEGGEGSKAEGKAQALAPAGPDPRKQIEGLQRELREAAFYRHLPSSINQDRAGTAFKLLEAEGRLVSRDGQQFIKLEENGLTKEVPLAQGLQTWAGSKSAEIFAAPTTGGAGLTQSSPGENTGTTRTLTPAQAMGAIWGQLP